MPVTRSTLSIHAQVLLGILIAELTGAPRVVAGTRQVIGVVAVERSASLDGIQLVDDQDPVVAGDRLATGPEGSALVRLSNRTQVNLSADTSVRFKASDGGIVVEMSSGTALAQGLHNETPVVEISAYRIEPVGSERTTYLVAILADRNALVFARTGQVRVTGIISGERRLIKTGEAARLVAEPGGVPGQEKEEGQPAPGKKSGQESGPAAPPSTSASHAGIFILAGGAAAIVAAVAVLAGGGGGGAGTSPPPPPPASPSIP